MIDDERTRATVETIWRIEAPRLTGGLVRFTGDLDRAEDMAQDALLAALEKWPTSGIPANPGAWLMTTAKNRAVDAARRRRMVDTKHDEIARSSELVQPPDVVVDASPVTDDVLRLMLTACHPVLSREARVALTLRLVAGLSTAEIARAFLTSEPTLAQRLVRAKRTLAEARVPFDIPDGEALHERVPAVLEVLYLIFNEGYSATAGDDWIRPALCEEAMRLCRVLAELIPGEAEVHGLVALMELQASRLRTRIGADGEPVLLLDQPRARWDHMLITRGLAALARAERLARPLGLYTLQAAIAACHARARTAADTDWARIVALYDALLEVTGSPVVALNRAMAVSMLDGPAAALPLVEALAEEPALQKYHWLPSARADLLVKLGRHDEARVQFQRAADLAPTDREREVLLSRAGLSARA